MIFHKILNHFELTNITKYCYHFFKMNNGLLFDQEHEKIINTCSVDQFMKSYSYRKTGLKGTCKIHGNINAEKSIHLTILEWTPMVHGHTDSCFLNEWIIRHGYCMDISTQERTSIYQWSLSSSLIEIQQYHVQVLRVRLSRSSVLCSPTSTSIFYKHLEKKSISK